MTIIGKEYIEAHAQEIFIISMRNHEFDNTVLMCGMYENESLALNAGVQIVCKTLIRWS